MQAALTMLAAYCLGSISFAIVVSRAMRLPDPRGYGSKNPGTTNVLRSGRKAAAASSPSPCKKIAANKANAAAIKAASDE